MSKWIVRSVPEGEAGDKKEETIKFIGCISKFRKIRCITERVSSSHPNFCNHSAGDRWLLFTFFKHRHCCRSQVLPLRNGDPNIMVTQRRALLMYLLVMCGHLLWKGIIMHEEEAFFFLASAGDGCICK